MGTGARAVHIMCRGTAVQSLVHDLPDNPYTEEVGTGARAVLFTMWTGTAVQSLVHGLPDSPNTEEVGTGTRAVHITWTGKVLHRNLRIRQEFPPGGF